MTDLVKSSAKKSRAHTRYYVNLDDVNLSAIPQFILQNLKIKHGKCRVPGTTTITGVMDKPALVKWANNLGLQGIDSKMYVDDLAGAGTCAHRMCELHCLGISDPTTHEDMNQFTKDQIDHGMTGYIKFMDWCSTTEFEPLKNELKLTHKSLLYGGTIDIYGVINNWHGKKTNKKVLIDLKTSKGVYGEQKTQVGGGYSLLLEDNNYEYDGVIILRIGRCEDEGFESIPLTPSELLNHQERFKICRELYESNKKCNNF